LEKSNTRALTPTEAQAATKEVCHNFKEEIALERIKNENLRLNMSIHGIVAKIYILGSIN
jgi:hypothetical protein